MATTDNPGSSGLNAPFNTGNVTVKEEEELRHSSEGKEDIANVLLNHTQTRGAKDKGVQYLVFSIVGYMCASIVFGFLLKKKGKESNT